ncbi:hypothetical protein CEUSTIGMA_g3754.t1 [Chlamydomonas eustigma]|uniref:Protein-S-isoprenylcysteine O-methyltransferase n=1 Tax=Chlamydomonas eustigma TaxID=1157962 RepID=A0A250WZP5_9CHLO|nr:hypothetical protein CEUSTIGMA_g3754.t1 [Chlamydomonas eustigma]|eukprot:GAX76308.1 hypothetical protein CEUSTIGMA_g3754.t1 [Chlamydomonas eustigma]
MLVTQFKFLPSTQLKAVFTASRQSRRRCVVALQSQSRNEAETDSKEPDFWWVEKFEARRKAEAELCESHASKPVVEKLPTSADQDRNSSNEKTEGKNSVKWDVPLILRAAVQLLQVLTVNAALVLWPAGTQPGGLLEGRVWVLYILYVFFFTQGTVRRLVAYGPLAPRSSDQQRKASWSSRLSWILFIMTVPLIHWVAMVRYVSGGGGAITYEAFTTYDLMGGILVLCALRLNGVASKQLGKAYNRLVPPEQLVTSGIYRHLRHPIYTSYMLLFVGYCLCLHSMPCAMAILFTCFIYYRQRCDLEERILTDSFGDKYQQYTLVTKSRFVPLPVI